MCIMKTPALIEIDNCRIDNSRATIIENFSWKLLQGEKWLIIGPNGGGKADFINALAQEKGLKIVPNTGLYSNKFIKSTEIVSLERAAAIIQEERENDESEYIEGGVDIGRTGRVFIAEGVLGKIKKGTPLPPFASKLDDCSEVQLCGIQKILDRGLKYMSTGEIRRTLLARALISGKELLLLSDPFAGLDVESRTILLDFIDKLDPSKSTVILSMERWHEIPSSITNVLEFSNKKISFCGTRTEYEALLQERESSLTEQKQQQKNAFSEIFFSLAVIISQTGVFP